MNDAYKFIVVLCVSGAISLASAVERPTEVLFFFDTEDYTSDRANDAVVKIAQTFTDCGVTGHFAIVGYLAKKWMDYGRSDVVEALKPHLVGTQTMYHSLHPNILEQADAFDFDAAYAKLLKEEREGVDLIKKALGRDDLLCGVPPGNSKSYLAMYVWADLGLPFFCDTVVADGKGGDIWFCNQRHVNYTFSMERFLPVDNSRPDYKKILDGLAGNPRVVCYLHPNMAIFKKFWDWEPYHGGNNVPFGQWEKLPERTPAEIQEYLTRLACFITMIRNDSRFKIVTLADKLPSRPRRAITCADLPTLRDQMKRRIAHVREPASWCVADVFQASVRLLRGEKATVPGKVFGFLEAPAVITGAVTVTRAEMVAAAKRIDLSTFLPSVIRVGCQKVGPADFLVGALDLLTSEEDEVVLTSREPLDTRWPGLQGFHPKGTWTHCSSFKDAYASDRLRWQVWTLRYEK